MYQHDGRDGARARSARIRAAHDGEATQLESMRRRSRGCAGETRRRSTELLSAALVRLAGRGAGRGQARASRADGLCTETDGELLVSSLGE